MKIFQEKGGSFLETRKLSDVIAFYQGKNSSRIVNVNNKFNYYDHSDFESDYDKSYLFPDNVKKNESDNIWLKAGDIVISNSLQLAAVVQKENEGKFLSLNFTKIEPIGEIDRMYFLYLFNINGDMKKKKAMQLQGTTNVQRIPLKALGEIIIPLPSLTEQHKIGEVYKEIFRLKHNLKKYSILTEQLTYSILEDKFKEK